MSSAVHALIADLKDVVLAGAAAASDETAANPFTPLNDAFCMIAEQGLLRDAELTADCREMLAGLTDPDLVGRWVQVIDERAFLVFGQSIVAALAKTSNLAKVSQHDFEPDAQKPAQDSLREEVVGLAHAYLNAFRRPGFLQKIYREIANSSALPSQDRSDSRYNFRTEWEALICDLLIHSNFHLGRLFAQRAEEYGDKTLFKLLLDEKDQDYSWFDADDEIQKYRRALIALTKQPDGALDKVAFLCTNCIEMVFLDLACLTTGIVNIMIPGNSVAEHVEFIVKQQGIRLLILSDEKQLLKVRPIKAAMPSLEKAVMIQGNSAEEWVTPLDTFIKAGEAVTDDEAAGYCQKVHIHNLATVMYTSGTTGEPKGIMFSHLNIVSKRFYRAMAIPGIGDTDRFLCYLPLFHTFGRWLEMTGCIFWGALYTFMENPSVEAMVENMQRIRATIFISIPKKWYQLYEYVGRTVDVQFGPKDTVARALHAATGGGLRYGLSAAGFLAPDVFIFFQRCGVELMSGFGMTEATGGITMTPPGDYRENSLGRALPGIEIKVADDGELLIRGPYVMMGYYDEAEDGIQETEYRTGDRIQETEYRTQSASSSVSGLLSSVSSPWLPTGDIMRMDKDGFIEILDRKKDIYKNVRGETIAPQRIENFFRDFEQIKQVFLVGDHQAFNTVLIYPDVETPDSEYSRMEEKERHDYVSSAIVSVNKFLAAFERIVDFRTVERAFSDAHGEITHKGTYKRRVIEQNFKDTIDSMYKKNYLTVHCAGLEVRVPNGFIREKGCLNWDITGTADGLKIAKHHLFLPIKSSSEKREFVQIGGYLYENQKPHLDLQTLLMNPLCWVGNQAFADFAGDAILSWYQQVDALVPHLHFRGVTDYHGRDERDFATLQTKLDAGEKSLEGLHLAAYLLQSHDLTDAEAAVVYFRKTLEDKSAPYQTFVLELLTRPALTPHEITRRELFRLCLPYIRSKRFGDYLKIYLTAQPDLFDEELIKDTAGTYHSDVVRAVHDFIYQLRSAHIADVPGTSATSTFEESGSTSAGEILPQLTALLQIIVRSVAQHPTRYKLIRRLLIEHRLQRVWPELAELAHQALRQARHDFRAWLGNPEQVAVDMETGEDYRWEDVIIFEEGITPDHRRMLLLAITRTTLLQETIFLLSEKNAVRLNHIPPGGVWISYLDDRPEVVVFRVSVQTRFQGSFEITLYLNRAIPKDQLLDMTEWHISVSNPEGLKGFERPRQAGAPAAGISSRQLVDEFGDYWEDFGIWTKEYVAEETTGRFIAKSMRNRKDEQGLLKLQHLWSFFVWNAAVAYYSFYKFTDYSLQLADPTPDNIVIPPHDYQSGTRIVSITERIACPALLTFLQHFYERFIEPIETQYPELEHRSIWNYVFAAMIDVEGEKPGYDLLKQALAELQNYPHTPAMKNFMEKLSAYLEYLETGTFMVQPLFFAHKRFHRWLQLNQDASITAQAQLLHDLTDTYHLHELEKERPDVRTRFFLETVFADSTPELKATLRNLYQRQHDAHISADEMLAAISAIQTEFSLNEKEQFFLTRLSYPHLKPTDEAALLTSAADGALTADVVVQVEDRDGNPFYLRRPNSPKEVSRLHKLFLENNMRVRFRHEHQFLVAVTDAGHIIGGLFYSRTEPTMAHMDKIAVSSRFRRKGVSEALMNELFSRLKAAGYESVTTGFFRPEYFYHFGFKIERKYAGLVKKL